MTDARTFLFTDQPWLAAGSVLSPEQESGDVSVVRTGACLLPDNRPLPSALAAFLDAGCFWLPSMPSGKTTAP